MSVLLPAVLVDKNGGEDDTQAEDQTAESHQHPCYEMGVNHGVVRGRWQEGRRDSGCCGVVTDHGGDDQLTLRHGTYLFCHKKIYFQATSWGPNDQWPLWAGLAPVSSTGLAPTCAGSANLLPSRGNRSSAVHSTPRARSHMERDGSTFSAHTSSAVTK